SDPCDQPRLQEDVEGVRVTAPTIPGRAAGRHHQDRSCAWRSDPVDAVALQLEPLGRMEEEQERVVSQGGLECLVGGLVTVAKCLQAHPSLPVARRERLAREMLDEFQWGDRAAESGLLLLHPLSPVIESGRPHPTHLLYGSGIPNLQRMVRPSRLPMMLVLVAVAAVALSTTDY